MKRRLRPRIRVRMNRLLLLLLAYAGGGTIINVAVAWIGAYTVRFGSIRSMPFGSSRSVDWTIGALPMGTRVWFMVHEPFEAKLVSAQLPPWARFPQNVPSPVPVNIWLYSEWSDGFGWPLISMSCYWKLDGAANSTVEKGLRIKDLPFGGPAQKERALPLEPSWRNFAINTAFYAGILWLLFTAPGLVRRYLRARRGQCPACAYPVGASEVCTECGQGLGIRD